MKKTLALGMAAAMTATLLAGGRKLCRCSGQCCFLCRCFYSRKHRFLYCGCFHCGEHGQLH